MRGFDAGRRIYSLVVYIQSNPNILGGRLCFAGTRVPVESLFDHLRSGYTLDYFLAQFPTVTREQVEGVLDMAKAGLLVAPFPPAQARRAAG